MSRTAREDGLGLVEVLVATVIAGVALAGALGTVEVAGRQVQQAGLCTRAFELAQSKLEAKRSVRWQMLLEDDLDDDGFSDVTMKDDGLGHDASANDGVYTASSERGGVTVVWSIEIDRAGPLSSVGMVKIQALATYNGFDGPKEIRMATFRANPAYVGPS